MKKRGTAGWWLWGCAVALAWVATVEAAPVVRLELNTYITNWLLVGPFPNRIVEEGGGATNRIGLFTDYLVDLGGEGSAVLTRATRIPGRASVEPTNVVSKTPEIDLDGVYGLPDLAVAYAYVNLQVRRSGVAYLHVGSDDGIRVWVDGQLVIDAPVERGYMADENWARVELRRGTHRVLVKVEDAFGAWKFSLRFTDEEVHRELLARQVREELKVEQVMEGGQMLVRIDTVPRVTDLAVRVEGRWVGGGGAVTQLFAVGAGELLRVPARLAGEEKVRLEAWGKGVPGKEPRRTVNIYRGSVCEVATNLAQQMKVVFDALLQTDVTARLAWRHEGILRLNLETAWEWSGQAESGCPIEVHQALTDVEEILAALERGEDFLGTITGTYRAAYISRVDGSAQPFLVTTPATGMSGLPMPLIVLLHDAGEEYSSEFERVPQLSGSLVVRVHGRGRSGAYVGLSGLDVFEVVGYMTNFYTVDADRIYLVGSGMGAYGVWSLGSREPGLWGGLLALGGNTADIPLMNLRNVAVRVVHGDRDQVTPVVYSRAAAHYLMTRACPVVYDEMREAGYRLQGVVESLRLFEWLLSHRREQDPREVELDAMYAWNERAHWLKIDGRHIARHTARAHGRFSAGNELVLYLDNVVAAEIELPPRYVDDESLLALICNGKYYEISAPLPPKIYVRREGERTVVAREKSGQGESGRSYRAGSWQQFFEGEPVMVVRGTGGSAEMTAAITACAEVVRRWSFPGRVMSRGGFEVRTDREVTHEDMERCHLILLGGPRENSVTAAMAAQLGAVVGERHVVVGEHKESLAGRGLWMCQLNPLASNRLVWIWASPETNFFDAGAAWIQEWSLPAVSPPDLLVVQLTPFRYVRALHFDENWNIDSAELASPQLSEFVRPPEFLARVFVRTLQSLTQSDYVWVSEQFRPLVQQVARLRAAEAATILLRHSTVFVCEIRGADLRELYRRVTKMVNGPQLLPAALDVDDERIYTVAVTPRGLRSLSEAAKATLLGASYHHVALRRTFRSMIEESLAF